MERIVIIGGGTGAALVHDLTLRGFVVTAVEKDPDRRSILLERAAPRASRCRRHLACSRVCPSEVRPARHIADLLRAIGGK